MFLYLLYAYLKFECYLCISHYADYANDNPLQTNLLKQANLWFKSVKKGVEEVFEHYMFIYAAFGTWYHSKPHQKRQKRLGFNPQTENKVGVPTFGWQMCVGFSSVVVVVWGINRHGEQEKWMTFSPLKVCWCCKRLTGMGDIKKEKMSGGLEVLFQGKGFKRIEAGAILPWQAWWHGDLGGHFMSLVWWEEVK